MLDFQTATPFSVLKTLLFSSYTSSFSTETVERTPPLFCFRTRRRELWVGTVPKIRRPLDDPVGRNSTSRFNYFNNFVVAVACCSVPSLLAPPHPVTSYVVATGKTNRARDFVVETVRTFEFANGRA